MVGLLAGHLNNLSPIGVVAAPLRAGLLAARPGTQSFGRCHCIHNSSVVCGTQTDVWVGSGPPGRTEVAMGTTRVHRIGMVAIAATTLVFTACTTPVPPGPSAAVDRPRTLTPLVDVDTGEQGILGKGGAVSRQQGSGLHGVRRCAGDPLLTGGRQPRVAASAFRRPYGPVVMGISGNGSVVPYVRFDNPFGNTYPRSVLRAHRRSMADVVEAPLPPDTAILANLSLSLSVSDDGRWVPVAYGPVAADHTFVPGPLSLWDTTTNTLHDYGTVPQRVPLATDGRFTGTVITADGNVVLFSARWTGLLGAAYDGVFRIDRVTGLVLPVWTRQVADTSEASGTTVVAFANRVRGRRRHRHQLGRPNGLDRPGHRLPAPDRRRLVPRRHQHRRTSGATQRAGPCRQVSPSTKDRCVSTTSATAPWGRRSRASRRSSYP